MAFRGSNKGDAGGGSPQGYTVNLPTGTVDGDLIIIAWYEGTGVSPSFPAGFVKFWEFDNGGQYNGLAWKIANSEPSSYTMTAASSAYACMIVASWSGRAAQQVMAEVESGIDSGDGSPIDATITGVTAAEGDDIAVFVFFNSISNNANPYATTSVPSGYTVREEAWDDYAAANLLTRDNVSAGATGNLSATFTSEFDSAEWRAAVVPLSKLNDGKVPKTYNVRAA